MAILLPCLLLPVREKILVLPSSAVAEIISYEKPKEISDAPDWLEGILNWRGINIPLTYLEKIGPPLDWNTPKSEEGEEVKKRYVAILNRTQKTQGEESDKMNRYPFFGAILQDVPKLQRISEDAVKIVTQFPEDNPRYIMEVKTHGDYVLVPNLPKLWKMIDALPSRLQWFRQIVL